MIEVTDEMLQLAQAAHREECTTGMWFTDERMRRILEAAIAPLNRLPF